MKTEFAFFKTREEAYEKEKERQRIEKEKEIARLRAQQERAIDKQAEKVGLLTFCLSSFKNHKCFTLLISISLIFLLLIINCLFYFLILQCVFYIFSVP